MKLSDLLQEKLGDSFASFAKPLGHPDEVHASIFKSGDEWLLNVVLSNFIPEINAKYRDVLMAEKALEDLATLGILVKGREAAFAEAERIKPKEEI